MFFTLFTLVQLSSFSKMCRISTNEMHSKCRINELGCSISGPGLAGLGARCELDIRQRLHFTGTVLILCKVRWAYDCLGPFYASYRAAPPLKSGFISRTGSTQSRGPWLMSCAASNQAKLVENSLGSAWRCSTYKTGLTLLRETKTDFVI